MLPKPQWGVKNPPSPAATRGTHRVQTLRREEIERLQGIEKVISVAYYKAIEEHMFCIFFSSSLT